MVVRSIVRRRGSGFGFTPVVDQSGLTGRYDFTLNFTPDVAMAALLGGPPRPAGDNLDAAPDLFAAFQQQLGLKLEPTRVPVDVMVIDKVERPSEKAENPAYVKSSYALTVVVQIRLSSIVDPS